MKCRCQSVRLNIGTEHDVLRPAGNAAVASLAGRKPDRPPTRRAVCLRWRRHPAGVRTPGGQVVRRASGLTEEAENQAVITVSRNTVRGDGRERGARSAVSGALVGPTRGAASGGSSAACVSFGERRPTGRSVDHGTPETAVNLTGGCWGWGWGVERGGGGGGAGGGAAGSDVGSAAGNNRCQRESHPGAASALLPFSHPTPHLRPPPLSC